jgi:3-hydroxyacyl-[acyl-carrier-protein] dehydratase
MLKGSLYKINTSFCSDGVLHALLEINEHHEIFEGHFPGQPVLPGACMLQMVKEILEYVFDRKLQLQKANNLKFLQLIDPQVTNVIQLKLTYKLLEDNVLHVNGSFISAENIAFKFQGTFIEAAL